MQQPDEDEDEGAASALSSNPGGGSEDDPGRVRVAVRIRPTRRRSRAYRVLVPNPIQVEVRIAAADSVTGGSATDDGAGAAAGVRQFTFDACLGPGTTQDQVFSRIGRDVVKAALAGYNGAVLAYGTTNSGKTYTCMGSSSNPGLVPRIAGSILMGLDEMRDRDADLTGTLQMQMMEIYDDSPYDLLVAAPASSASGYLDRTKLRVREHPTRGPFCENCTEVQVDNLDDVLHWIELGQKNRVSASTAHNARSSRSHAIVMLNVRQHNRRTNRTRTSTMHLVDLAGSERSTTDPGSDLGYVKETSTINCSLTVLGRIISDLADQGESRAFRQSKLTFLLKSALDRQTRVWLLATISPSERNHRDTIRTLEYAQRAMRVAIQPVSNESATAPDQRRSREDDWDRVRRMVKIDLDEVRRDAGAVSAKVRALLQHRERVQAENRRLKQVLTRYESEPAVGERAGTSVPPILEFATRHGLLDAGAVAEQLSADGDIRRVMRWAADHLTEVDQFELSAEEAIAVRTVLAQLQGGGVVAEHIDVIANVSAEHDYLIRASRLIDPRPAPRLLFLQIPPHYDLVDCAVGLPNLGTGVHFVAEPEPDRDVVFLCEVMAGSAERRGTQEDRYDSLITEVGALLCRD